jgi:hypothetical protein
MLVVANPELAQLIAAEAVVQQRGENGAVTDALQ